MLKSNVNYVCVYRYPLLLLNDTVSSLSPCALVVLPCYHNRLAMLINDGDAGWQLSSSLLYGPALQGLCPMSEGYSRECSRVIPGRTS